MSTHDELFLQAMNEHQATEKNNQQDILQGKICGKGDSEFFVSAGGKSEMILPFAESLGELSVGDEVEVVLDSMKNGTPHVSQKKALAVKAVETIAQASEDNTPVKAVITKLITNQEGQNSGFEVSIDGVRAFLPMSHIRTQNPEQAIGNTYDVAVIKYEPNRIVVSERILREKFQKEGFESFCTSHKEGSVIDVCVDEVNDSYALVSSDHIRMFMHITEFDWKFIKNLKDVLKKGDCFPVKIQSIDSAKRSIKVSRKAVLPNPRDLFMTSHKPGDTLSAGVVRFVRGLAIVESDESVELLLPVEEMSWTRRVSDPKQILNLGDRIKVQIKEIDADKKRIVVSLREMLENPWKNASSVYTVGTKHEGTIISLTDFGIFVMFNDGIQGLVRIEDIDWENPNINLAERFKVGDPLTTTVLNVDSAKEKLRVGIKQLSKNPYQNFLDNHKVGSIVSAKVTKINKDSVDVEVEGGLPASIHISHLSLDHVDSPDSVCKIGDSVKTVLRRINTAQQKIELSIKDFVKTESQQELNQILQSHKSEIPTLGSVFGDLLSQQSKK